jgi:O-methyltransferase involved in polyketide biosynthesis
LKAKGIQEIGPRPNLHLIAEDLVQHRLVDVLAKHKDWDATAMTTIVAEGLLQYLKPDAVRDLFKQCASIAGDSRIAFTYIPTRQDGRPDAGPLTGFVLWVLKVSGEPWLWSIDPDDLEQYLEEVGWRSAPDLEPAGRRHGVEIYAVARIGQPVISGKPV